MRILQPVFILCVGAVLANAANFEFKDNGATYDVSVDGKIWLQTVTPKFDNANRDETYKVYTQMYDFDGKQPVTKGAGGKFPHHRGLFIGWKDTIVNGEDLDTWHMTNCTQQHVAWMEPKKSDSAATQIETVEWRNNDDKPFITETRAITVAPGEDGARIFDFQSKLTSLAGKIELKGDLQHAGMQVRMAQEVAEHETTTQYVLPAGAATEKDDKVTGAWWACCNCEIGKKRFWIIHMTHPSVVPNAPVYSIRLYARFGAFWEPTLEEGVAQQYNFRVVLSEKPLDQAACQALYDAYAKTIPATL